MVTQKITESDITYITNNLIPILSSLLPEENREQLNQLKKILSVETLTIMQVIGFNYKKAIGEPLTLLLSKIIESKIPVDNKINLDYILSMAELAKDVDATKRFYQLTKQEFPNE